MIYAIIFVTGFLSVILTVLYIISKSWSNFDSDELSSSKERYCSTHRKKELGPGHGAHTPYGSASSNGAASAWIARSRNK